MYKSSILKYCFSTTRSQINYSKNYYKILQLSLTCDQKLIKNSYLQLVKKLHPDVNPNGKQQFTEVKQAYQILSNDQLKKQYDQNRNLYNNSNNNNNNSNNNNSSSKSYSQYQYTNNDSNNHGYYTHRTYNSDNYQDYFYDNPKPNYNHNNNNNKNYHQSKYQQKEQQQKKFNRKGQKHQNTKQQWQKYKQENKSSRYQHQTQQQRNIRDKLDAMRGFTSPHNVMWNRQHLRYKTLMNQHNQKNQNQQIIKKIVPDKVKKFYDKIMDKVVKSITGN